MERCADMAERIGDILCNAAQWEGHRCSWIGAASQTADRPFNFYNGAAGVAWFLSSLHRLTGNARTERVALSGAKWAIDQAAHHISARSLGTYSGAVGVALACLDIGSASNDERLIARAAEVLRRCAVCAYVGDEAPLDVMHGAAGIVPVFLLLFGETGSLLFIEAARRGAELLLKRVHAPQSTSDGSPQVVPFRSGFSHGASGFALAFASIYHATCDQRFASAAEGLFDRERKSDIPSGGSRAADGLFTSDRPTDAWCHGTGGRALARLIAAEQIGNLRLRAEADEFLESTLGAYEASVRRPGNFCEQNYSLCHGLAGFGELFRVASLRNPSRWKEHAEAVAMQMLDGGAADPEHWPFSSGEGINCPGIMSGLAGAGLFLMRLCQVNPLSPLVLWAGSRNWAIALM